MTQTSLRNFEADEPGVAGIGSEDHDGTATENIAKKKSASFFVKQGDSDRLLISVKPLRDKNVIDDKKSSQAIIVQRNGGSYGGATTIQSRGIPAQYSSDESEEDDSPNHFHH